MDEPRFLDGVTGLRGFDEESWSREGVLRSRGLIILDLAVCCKFSLEGAGRRLARGTGSFEGLGIPDGLFPLVDWSMMATDVAILLYCRARGRESYSVVDHNAVVVVNTRKQTLVGSADGCSLWMIRSHRAGRKSKMSCVILFPKVQHHQDRTGTVWHGFSRFGMAFRRQSLIGSERVGALTPN
jgi:hypothetical protein